MNSGLGVRIPLHSDRLARSFAGAGVGLCPLPSHRQAAHVTHSTVALDALQALEVNTEFSTQIAFDHILAVLDGVYDLRKLRFGEILCPDARVDIGASQHLHRVDWADSIDVAQGNINALVRRNFHSNNACHNSLIDLTLTLFVALVRADNTNDAPATHNLAVLAKFFN